MSTKMSPDVAKFPLGTWNAPSWKPPVKVERTQPLNLRGLKSSREAIPHYFSFWFNFLCPVTEQNTECLKSTEKDHWPILEDLRVVCFPWAQAHANYGLLDWPLQMDPLGQSELMMRSGLVSSSMVESMYSTFYILEIGNVKTNKRKAPFRMGLGGWQGALSHLALNCRPNRNRRDGPCRRTLLYNPSPRKKGFPSPPATPSQWERVTVQPMKSHHTLNSRTPMAFLFPTASIKERSSPLCCGLACGFA